ncbi:MAG: mechanosensitive ion channel family protein [Corallococcus sp.]|nr:mechanosensitive ion channel family protein [Corallococcus sp.]
MAKKFKEELKSQANEIKAKAKNLGPVRITVLIILAIGTVFSYIYYGQIFGEDTVFTKDYGNDFLNVIMGIIPKIIRSLQIITITEIIANIVLFVVSHSFAKSQRGITVSRLICNLVRWIVVIVLVIVVLAVWGVDTTALVTGAGVLTLVVGLGMQSLIADVVAGLFIIFENEFNVGDIITVDGFRGEVVSIGIRTTKLKAAGNIKIINNSDIRGILNQTVEPSVAKAYIAIEYGESLARVEKIIEQNLKNLSVEGTIGGLCYDGVNELGASGVTLQFTAKCNEQDIFAVQRAMNKALKVMFDEHGINIPFDQLVVHVENQD